MQEILQKQGMIGGKQMRFRCRKTPNSLAVVVQSGSAAPILQTKTVTPSSVTQTISPSSGYDGFSSFTVNGDSDLVSNNIKSGINIFGVTGSYSSQLNKEELNLQPIYYISDNEVYVDFPSTIATDKIFAIYLNGSFETTTETVSVEKNFTVFYYTTTSTYYRFQGTVVTGTTTRTGSSPVEEYSLGVNQKINIKINSPNTLSFRVSTSTATMATVKKGEGTWYGGELIIYYYS